MEMIKIWKGALMILMAFAGEPFSALRELARHGVAENCNPSMPHSFSWVYTSAFSLGATSSVSRSKGNQSRSLELVTESD
jgi:hypothetical protein